MNLDKLVPFLLEFFFLLFFDIIIIVSLYNYWIKKKYLEKYFELWKGTKKSIIWYVSWSFAICLNLIIYTIFAILIIKKGYAIGLIGLCLLFSITIYLLILGTIYLLVKWNIKAKHDKR